MLRLFIRGESRLSPLNLMSHAVRPLFRIRERPTFTLPILACASTKADTKEPAIGAAVSATILSLMSGEREPSICAPTKRSRKHAFDAVAEGTYEVESIVAERSAKGKPEFLIK